MDFNYLIELARENEARSKNDESIKFSTKVSNPKKIIKPGPKGSAIQSVLSKKCEEKSKIEKEYLKKKEELMALRATNKRSQKRVSQMINRTKGASKSVLDDAKDITTAKGEEQCDEDDYGYESAMSQQIFSKLQNQYSEIPEDERLKINKTEKKKDIEDIKSRVLNSLKKTHEEEIGVRKRTRKRKSGGEDDGFINDGDEYKRFKKKEKESRETKRKERASININLTNHKSDKYTKFKYDKSKSESKPIKKKKSVPPPAFNFQQLLQVAKKKQSEPLPIEDPLEQLKNKQLKKKEILDQRPLTAKEKMELEEERIRKLRRMGKLPPTASISKQEGQTLKSKEKSIVETSSKKYTESSLKKVSSKDKAEPPPLGTNSRFFAKSSGSIEAPPSIVKKEKSTNDLKSSSSKSLQETSKRKEEKKPLRSVDVSCFPKKSLPPQSFKRRIDSEDEEDYDSEMDDFIDDDEAEVDYSSEIARMFKYDKSKYREIDDNCDDMEASYSQLQREEKYSEKMGLIEDLEDIRREEEEKKKKRMRRK